MVQLSIDADSPSLNERSIFHAKMNTISTKEEQIVLRFLKLQGCCLRCRLRFIGYRTTQCNSTEFPAQANLANLKVINGVLI